MVLSRMFSPPLLHAPRRLPACRCHVTSRHVSLHKGLLCSPHLSRTFAENQAELSKQSPPGAGSEPGEWEKLLPSGLRGHRKCR